MKKLEDIKTLCQQTINEYNDLLEEDCEGIEREEYRAELAEEILEILNGEKS